MHNKLIQRFAERFAFDEATLVSTLKATAFKIKEGVVSDAQLLALLIVADQYSLNPFTREIFAFPDKHNGIVPVVGVDGWSRIINQHPEFDGMEFRMAEKLVELPGARPCPEWMECVLYRKDRGHPAAIREYLDEVYREPATSERDGRPVRMLGPWQTHTKRFLRHKTMIQAARLVFGFGGIYDPDEAERILDGQADGLALNPDTATGLVIEAPSDTARRMAAKLVSRAESAGGAWQAALDYAGERYHGIDLEFIRDAIRTAQQQSLSAAAPKGAATGSAAIAEARQLLQRKDSAQAA